MRVMKAAPTVIPSVAGSDIVSLASLIAASWNQLMERLKTIGSLRDLAEEIPLYGLVVTRESRARN